uniref:WASH complex subunit FAM21 n=1 Tax=Ceratitis capitata TaxID=7213 RepID=W8B762_CERCA
MEESSRAEKIIPQATQWSFEGDCSLLAWMQDLSQHLENRATATTDALQQLNVNVNRTAIALDNAANSLTALQYSQFVESRCHDDDETQSNTTEVQQEACAMSSDEVKSPKKVLETFLKNNLEMLHNCHEKYALDFEDSDEDEAATNINCIYQPKNPYNDALLPHIYGSKLWKEHWHVGLCDGTNEYSGDEASDAFSQTSSSSAADNESYESNTANLSEWASSTSIPIEHKHPSLMTAPREPTLAASVTTAAAARVKRLPNNQRFPNNDDSDTCSTTSHSTTTNPTHTRVREPDLFAAIRHATPNTSTSASSSPQQPVAPPVQRENNIVPPYLDATPPVDIFADPPPAQQSIIRRAENESVQQKPANSQIKRKPVNLFDDDDFNSFMTEVVDKAQTKTGHQQPQQVPEPASRTFSPTKTNITRSTETPVITPKTVDLFAEPLFSKPEAEIFPKTAPVEIEKSLEIKQRKPVNLFESLESSPPNHSLFSGNKDNNIKTKDIVTPIVKPGITAKSLFDDDDEDDDDFLNAFGSKKLSLPTQSTGKTLLFDDADTEVEPSQLTKSNLRTSSNLFDDTPPEDDFLQNAEEIKNKTIDIITTKASVSDSINEKKLTASGTKNINEKVGAKITTSTKTNQENQLTQVPAVTSTAHKVFSSDLFGDDDSDDLDDIFKKPTTKAATIKPITDQPSKVANEKLKVTSAKDIPPPLFGNDFVDDDNDLFGTKIKDQSKPANLNSQNANKPARSITSIFGDDFDDETDDLFAVRPNYKTTKGSTDKSTASAVAKESIQNLREQKNVEKTVEQTIETEIPKPQTNVSKIKPLFEEENFENETNNMFGSANKETLPTTESSINKESTNGFETGAEEAAVVEKPEDNLLNKTSEDVLFGDKDKEIINASRPTKDVTKEQVVANEMNTTPHKALTEDATKTVQNATPNKVEEINVGASNIVDQSDIPKKATAELPENTPQATPESIDSSVADIDVPVASEKLFELNNQKYAGIFLDEPPDDDDFFTTLASNPKPLSASKLTLDLENDFYEPTLPDLPNLAKTTTTGTTTNTQSVVGNNKTEAGTSDYGGLRLFSEIPPDDFDDDIDFSFAPPPKQPTTVAGGVNQRLHSVFYDDFSETLEAVQQLKDNNKIASAHALFDDEPPPDDKLFEGISKATTPGEPVAGKHTSESEDGKQNVDSKDVTDRSIQKTADIDESLRISEKPRSTAGKLQMPNIKINVQALLPGGGSRPSFKKSASAPDSGLDTHTPSEISVPQTPTNTALSADINKTISSASFKSTSTATKSSNENLLPSICKTRVRAPIGRRPSTRRARQENYRQSLIAEQAENKVEEEVPSTSGLGRMVKEPIAPAKPPQKDVNESNPMQPAISNLSLPTALKPTNEGDINALHQADLFTDEDEEEDDYDKLFTAARIRNMQANNVPEQTQYIRTNPYAATNQNVNIVRRTPNTQAVSDKKLSAFKRDNALMADQDEEDDLFKGLSVASSSSVSRKQSNNGEAATTKSQTIPSSKSIFGTPTSEDSDDDLFKSSKLKPVITKAATKPTQSLQQSASVRETQKVTTTGAIKKLDSIFGSDDEDDDDFLSNLKPKKYTTTATSAADKPKSSTSGGGLFSDIESDEDDLFGGKSKPKQTSAKPKATTTTKAPTKSSNLKPKTIIKQPLNNEATLADNPLADLLDP